MKTLHISKDLALPLDAVTQTFALLAVRGAGKTYAAAVLVEELAAAGQAYVVVDPTGAWHGLRSSADGQKPGLPVVIMGGDHGDVPLAPESGEVVADFVVAERQPVVLDLSLMRKAEAIRFMTSFAETLYRKNREPLHLVVDEADAYAPQRPMPDQARLLGAMEDIVRRGRIRGIGVTMISQRAAVLNKSVLTQIETLVVLRTTSPQDRAAIETWIEANATDQKRDEVIGSLAGLPNGEAWLWSPQWLRLLRRVHFRARHTFNSSATPKVGEKRIEPRRMADVDLTTLKERIAATIEKAKENDPAALRREVARLKGELAARATLLTVKKPSPAEMEKLMREMHKTPAVFIKDPTPKRIEVPVLKEAHVKRLEATVCKFETMGANTQKMMREFLAVVAKAVALPPEVLKPRATAGGMSEYMRIVRADQNAHSKTRVADTHALTLVPQPADGFVMSAGERAVLTAVAQEPEQAPVSRAQLTILTGYARSSRDKFIQRLRSAGYLATEELGDGVLATEAGRRALGPDFQPLPTGAALREHWLNELRGGEKEVLSVVLARYPDPVTRDQITEATGYARSSRDKFLQHLAARRLVVFGPGSGVTASALLF